MRARLPFGYQRLIGTQERSQLFLRQFVPLAQYTNFVHKGT